MNRQLWLTISMLAMLLGLVACGAPSAPAPAVESAPTAEATPTAEAAAEAAPTAEPAPEEAAAPADAATATYRTFTIVPAESKAMYLVDETFLGGALDKLGIAAGDVDVIGSTNNIEGQLLVDVAGAAIGPSEFRVNIAQLSTDQNRRDNWIRTNGPRLGDYPVASFKTIEVKNGPAGYVEGEQVSFQLVGDLTIREITQPITFDVTATLTGDTITGSAMTTTLMSNFGIEPPSFANTLTVADEFKIQVDFTAREQ